MEIEKTNLLKALDAVRWGLSAKGSTLQPSVFIFSDKKVMAYNGETNVMAHLPDLDFEAAIEANTLYEYLKKVKKETIKITKTDKEVILSTGTSKVGFSLFEGITGAEITPPDTGFTDLPENFLEGVQMAIPCTAKDDMNPILSCVNFNVNGNIEASDNFRIFQYNVGKLFSKDINIPADSLKNVLKINAATFAETADWIHFSNPDGIVVSCRVFSEKFVNVQGVLDTFPSKGIQFDFPEMFLHSLEKAAIFSNAKMFDAGNVDISFRKKKLWVESASETAWFKEQFVVKDTENNDFTFTVSLELLMYILKQSNSCIITDNLLKFENKNWIYISTLIKEAKDISI